MPQCISVRPEVYTSLHFEFRTLMVTILTMALETEDETRLNAKKKQNKKKTTVIIDNNNNDDDDFKLMKFHLNCGWKQLLMLMIFAVLLCYLSNSERNFSEFFRPFFRYCLSSIAKLPRSLTLKIIMILIYYC